MLTWIDRSECERIEISEDYELKEPCVISHIILVIREEVNYLMLHTVKHIFHIKLGNVFSVSYLDIIGDVFKSIIYGVGSVFVFTNKKTLTIKINT